MTPERDERGRLLPGHTANPNGRPKRKTFRDYFTEEEEVDLINKVKQALDERPEIMKLAVEQLFGKPRQNIGLDGGEEGQPVIFSIAKELSDKNGISSTPSTEGDSER